MGKMLRGCLMVIGLGVVGLVVLVVIMAASGSRGTSTGTNTSAGSSTTRPATTVAGPPEAAITMTGKDIMKSDSFLLRGGNYTVTWRASTSSALGQTLFSVRLVPENGSYGETLVNTIVKSAEPATGAGSTNAYNVKPGRYYLDANSGAEWSVTLQPR